VAAGVHVAATVCAGVGVAGGLRDCVRDAVGLGDRLRVRLAPGDWLREGDWLRGGVRAGQTNEKVRGCVGGAKVSTLLPELDENVKPSQWIDPVKKQFVTT
jgi:hypothetical protein